MQQYSREVQSVRLAASRAGFTNLPTVPSDPRLNLPPLPRHHFARMQSSQPLECFCVQQRMEDTGWCNKLVLADVGI